MRRDEESPRNTSGHLKFVEKDGNEVTLHEGTWKGHILGSPGRAFLEYNLEAIAQTLRDPDVIRQSNQRATSKLYYRAWTSFEFRSGIRLPARGGNKYLVVVVKDDSVVQTIYLGSRIKQGKKLWQKI